MLAWKASACCLIILLIIQEMVEMDEQYKQLSNERSALGEKLIAKQSDGLRIKQDIKVTEDTIHQMSNEKYKVYIKT